MDNPSNVASDNFVSTNLVETSQGAQTVDEQDKMFIFTDARIHLDRIIRDWDTEVADTEVRRKTRKVEIDIEGLRQKGDLDEDETIIPVRVIDTNIQREQPPYINYLKNSRRLAIFASLDNPNQDVDLLEQAFTEGMTYTGWETPHYKCIDGSMAHGWDAIEVVADNSKPLGVALEHVGHDRLLFPRSAIDIQQCPRIIRSYDVTLLQLQKWVTKYGFNQQQIDKIRDARKNTQKENETTRLYKLYFKKDGVVYIAWFAMESGCDDWLKAPVPHTLGMKKQVQTPSIDPATFQTIFSTSWVDEPLTLYPVFILPYRETEESKIVDHKGRCFLDEYKQEAQTAILSGFVNKLTRSANIYASPSQDDGSGSSLKEIEDLVLRGGRVLSKPVNFWSTPPPDWNTIRALEYFSTSNSEETNQVNFAAMNREDSRKTAKEIGAAQQQQQLLNSVQLTLFSTHIRSIYAFAWLVVQSLALQGEIKFLLAQVPKMHPLLPNQPLIDPNSGQPVMEWGNNVPVIEQTYDVRAAGDVDVVQKQEIIFQMQQDWAVISQTPLASQFLADYIELKYPQKAQQYKGLLLQMGAMQQMQSLIARLSLVTQGLLKDAPGVVNTLQPQEQQMLQQTLQEAQQFTSQQTQTTTNAKSS